MLLECSWSVYWLSLAMLDHILALGFLSLSLGRSMDGKLIASLAMIVSISGVGAHTILKRSYYHVVINPRPLWPDGVVEFTYRIWIISIEGATSSYGRKEYV